MADKDLDDFQEGEDEEDLTNLDEYILEHITQLKDTKHISFFGFSGTPKKTLEMLGTRMKVDLPSISFVFNETKYFRSTFNLRTEKLYHLSTLF